MNIFTATLCHNLESLGLKVATDTRFAVNFAFNGPVNLLSGSLFVRSKIDAFSYLGNNSTCLTSSIGRYCSIADNVVIGMGQHDGSEVTTSKALCVTKVFDFAGYHTERMTAMMKRRNGEETSNVTVGNDVWIGSHVLIPSSVTIGHGAIIGAGAVITKDVPPYAVVVGNNRIVKYRFSDELISDLLELNWWNYNLPAMQKNCQTEDGLYLDKPKDFIQYMKSADPATLITLPVRWYFVDLSKAENIVNNLKLVPVHESISLYL